MLSARTNSPVCSHIRTFVLLLMILRCNPSAYNVDSRNVLIFSDPVRVSPQRRGSYFGFSVALYAGAGGPLLLAGAPRANSTATRRVNEPGTVFTCAMSGVCKEWLLDSSKNGVFPRDKRIVQVKDNAWIGASIAVENKTAARVVVCGPRWKVSTHYMQGICYGTLASGADAFDREAKRHWLPVFNATRQRKLSDETSHYNYAFAQVGFSLHMKSWGNSADIALGGPGVFAWTGDTVAQTSRGRLEGTVFGVRSRRYGISCAIWVKRYAITAGAYFKKDDILYAAGAAKGAALLGKVLVFTFPTTEMEYISVKAKLESKQIGEYFGAALTSCDVNNDGKDELIVGAPYWAEELDEGRVYIFTTQHSANFKLLTKIDGKVAGGRFGSALMCLGDVDYDGYGDFAVGAPYEEESGGAVYIYHGNLDGVFRRYSQRLVGSDYSLPMRGFGISISEPRDINGDRYPDFAVGAYLSEKVVLLRTVPVVTVNVTLEHLRKIRLLRNTTSFVIDVQVYYEGAYVPESLRIVKVLRIDQTHGRVAYRGQSNHNGIYRIPDVLHRNSISHSSFEMYFMGEVQDILNPLEVSVSVELEDDFSVKVKNSSWRDAHCISCVMINKFLSKTEDLMKLPFAVDCGDDEICVADLNVTLSTDLQPNNSYVIGSSSTISLRVDARNRGEAAYQTKVTIAIEVLSLASIPSECTENSRTSNTQLVVVCEIGNPLRTNKSLMLQLDTSMVTYDVRQAVIQANISTHSTESTPSDNSHATSVYFDVDMDIAIVGKAQVSSYSYSRENKEIPLDNVRFQHFYEVQRFGVSPIEEVALTLRIPTHWRRHRIGDITVANIESIVGTMDGSAFHCGDFNRTDAPFTEGDLKIASAAFVLESPRFVADDSRHVNSSNEYSSLDLPSANRTLYINCTNEAVRCEQVSCKVGPFASTLSVAKLLVTLDLQVPNFHAALMKDKDIVFFVSEGNVAITQPYNITQRNGHKPDAALVATTFLGSPIAERIAVWILVLSIALGIVLLLLLILALIKIGFFNRKKKMELEALKAETDVCLAFSQSSANENFGCYYN
ncbi:Integrin alpha-PS4 [Harpegnathos saltator]|uniref:Integrin alpha-PS4 n=1 Tax=Harpegnathos saltator TaxID=610380 RepID=E2B366_HARSA|nr:Integrin alpha-PS4 [Harpegnathos saltator]